MAASLNQRYVAEAEKIRKQLTAEFKDMLRLHQDCEVTLDKDSNTEFTFTLTHPDLMDDSQARMDMADMMSVARTSPLVKTVAKGGHTKPTFTDLYKGLFLPSISISVKMV